MRTWIEIRRTYQDDAYDWYPRIWQACLCTENGRILMKAKGHYRKIDAVRCAKKLQERFDMPEKILFRI